MNIEQAKAIPLDQILQKIGYSPTKERKHEAVYFSPLRNEKTPSFNLNTAKNLWFDFGEGIGGNTIDFAIAYLKSQSNDSSVSCALRWISNMAGSTHIPTPSRTRHIMRDEPKLIVKDVSPIKHRALISYLHQRGIAKSTADTCLKEVRVFNPDSQKDFFALSFANEENGYELRNPFFKGCAGSKAISFIRGKRVKPDGIHIFEGCFDYLSAINYRNVKQFDDDTIVLNSLSCIQQAFPYMRDYGYRVAYSWLDNDRAGQKALNTLNDFFQSEEHLRHREMNNLYLPHKDVNAWHMHRLQLSL